MEVNTRLRGTDYERFREARFRIPAGHPVDHTLDTLRRAQASQWA